MGRRAGDRRRGAAAGCRRLPRRAAATGRAGLIAVLAAALAAAFGAGGGGSPPRPEAREPPIARLEAAVAPRRAVVRTATVTVGRSAEGRPIRAVARNGIGDARGGDGGGPLVLAFGCIHGDECAGIDALALADRGCPPYGDGLVLVPNLNPDGRAAGTRTNANGVDLNRNFAVRLAPDRRPRRSPVLRTSPVLRARDQDRPAADPRSATRRDDLVSPGVRAAGARLGPERPGGAPVRPPLRRAVLSHALARRHGPELAEPPLRRHELVRGRTAERGSRSRRSSRPGDLRPRRQAAGAIPWLTLRSPCARDNRGRR